LVVRLIDVRSFSWGNRQLLMGCWGRNADEKSVRPGMMSTSMNIDSLSRNTSN